MQTFESTIEKGVNYLADYLGKADVLSLALDPFKDIATGLIVGYPIYKIKKNIDLSKGYEELLKSRMSKIELLFKPEFLRGYNITYGSAKKGGMSYFDKMGAINNLSGTMFDIFIYSLEATPNFFIDKFYVKDLGEILYKSDTFGSCINKLKSKYEETKIGTYNKISESLKFVKKQDEIKTREGKKNECGTGGWIVNPIMRKFLLEKNAPITYMLTVDTEIKTEEEKRKIKACEPLTKEDTEVIAKESISMPWGIAKVGENGEFKEWLIKPEPYPKIITYVNESGERLQEEKIPFQRAGILWMFKKDGGRYYNMCGGDKAPGSSVGAPLNPQFIDLILEGDEKGVENKEKFKNAVDTESKSFVAALEVCFKDRPKENEISWEKKWNYPMWLPDEYQKNFIGVHTLNHIEKIIVKDISSL